MSFLLVQEEADAAEGRVEAEGAVELTDLGVFAVLVVLQSLAVAAGERTVPAAMHGRLPPPRAVFAQHVAAQLLLAFAGVRADLAHERLVLMPQFVAAELVGAVAAVRTLITLEPTAQRNKGRHHITSTLINYSLCATLNCFQQ